MSQRDRQEHEALSALMDNEADDLELRRLLKACDKDPQLAQTWERFHLVQSLLHDPRVTPVSATLATSITAQLQHEATLSSPRPATFSGWQQHLSKIAIAASVAVVFIVGIQTQLPGDATPAVAQQEPAPTIAPETLLASETAVEELDPAATQFLFEYIGRMAIDERAPVRTEHIQESPLYRLVNEVSDSPQ